MEDVIQAAACALVNQWPLLQGMTASERHERFKLIVAAALLAYAEAQLQFSEN